MPKRISQKSGSELFIVDNSIDDWRVVRYLHDWCQLSKSIDIATGYFEIGSLLSLDGQWQKVDKIRVLMGDNVSLRTHSAFQTAFDRIKSTLDNSLEKTKERNPFLTGVTAIVDALQSGKIECRVYRKEKFHAKAYITHARMEVVGSAALVGSSNFTYPGLHENIELNVQITGGQVSVLQEWFNEHWEEAEEVTPEILKVVERHVREYSPFEIYAKSLQEFFRGHELTATEWEHVESKMFPKLDQYQKEGYQSLMKIARQYNGAFLCDGVGLGKTFIGLMLIERLIMHERKRVALFVPKTGRVDVWEKHLRKYLPHVGGVSGGDFSNLSIFNHTDLSRSGDYPERFTRIRELVDVVIIDEAHHFRNPGIAGKGERRPSRYRSLYDLVEPVPHNKQMFMLTATPINNYLEDFRHMFELFTRKDDYYFKDSLGVHSVGGHFRKLEKDLINVVAGAESELRETNMAEARDVLRVDSIFKTLVVQRSRAYVKKSQEQEGGRQVTFPDRKPPGVKEYSIKKAYGPLLTKVEEAFSRTEPLFRLGIYYPLFYLKDEPKQEKKGAKEDILAQTFAFKKNMQKQVVSLIRIQFLKRFESSALAFECSCCRLFIKLLVWIKAHTETAEEKAKLAEWERKNADLIKYVHEKQHTYWDFEDDEKRSEEDLVTEEMLDEVDIIKPRSEYRFDEIMRDTYLDLDQSAEFIKELKKFKPSHDDKLVTLTKLLQEDPVLKKNKVLIFSEFAETARYLRDQLKDKGIQGVDEIDGGTERDRGQIIRQFAPYYNDSSSAKLKAEGLNEIRVLISTDVLSEGLNLQDATRLINYDLHWNPVRLMQRIGRVDRRMNPEIEKQILNDHPEQKELRGKVEYWNFLPPDELDALLKLYSRVSHKTLRISKTLGIEGRKLLRPEDDFDALKDLNEAYEGKTSLIEEMHLELQKLLKDYPELAAKLGALPGKVFSGKKHPSKGAKAVFFCYRIPRPDQEEKTQSSEIKWTEEAGETRWYLYDLSNNKITETHADIISVIRSKPETPRACKIEQKTLEEIRSKVNSHIIQTYLKQLQAPQGIKPVLKCWMELN